MIESRIEYCQANANGSTSSPESYHGTEGGCDCILQSPSIAVVADHPGRGAYAILGSGRV